MGDTGERAQREDNLRRGPKSPKVTSAMMLEELDLHKKQASEWLQLAALPPKALDAYFAAVRKTEDDLVSMDGAMAWRQRPVGLG